MESESILQSRAPPTAQQLAGRHSKISQSNFGAFSNLGADPSGSEFVLGNINQ